LPIYIENNTTFLYRLPHYHPTRILLPSSTITSNINQFFVVITLQLLMPIDHSLHLLFVKLIVKLHYKFIILGPRVFYFVRKSDASSGNFLIVYFRTIFLRQLACDNSSTISNYLTIALPHQLFSPLNNFIPDGHSLAVIFNVVHINNSSTLIYLQQLTFLPMLILCW
jgi:hypothetical protein